MTKRIITFDGTEITCFLDGSISRVSKKTGKVLTQFGTDNGNGYRRICINNKTAYVHRLIALAFLGDIDSLGEIDHIDGDKSNNVPSNLRIVTKSENQRASRKEMASGSSRYRGVSWSKRLSKWVVQISADNGKNYIGLFTDEIDAAKAYDASAIASGFLPEALNFSVRDAQKLLLCALHVAK